MRWRVLLGLTLGLAAADSRAQTYPTPGFDCANASTPQELRICRSPQLGELDGRHWYLAERAIRGSSDPEGTRSAVEAWISNVRNVCETDKCLLDAYAARVAVLERDVAKLAPPTPPPLPAAPLLAPTAPALASAKPPVEVLTPSPSVAAAVPAPALKPATKSAPRVETEPQEHEPIWLWFVAAALFIAAVAIAAIKK